MSGAGPLLYLVRHGESIWNLERRLTGWSDVPLTEHGRAQARALRPLLADLEVDAAWASPLQRARETGALAWEGPQLLDDRIREFHFGAHEGALIQELDRNILALFRRFESFQAPEGESGLQFHERVDAFFDALPSGRHLVFTHGGVVRRALERTGELRFVNNAGVTLIDWKAQKLLGEWPNPLES